MQVALTHAPSPRLPTMGGLSQPLISKFLSCDAGTGSWVPPHPKLSQALSQVPF